MSYDYYGKKDDFRSLYPHSGGSRTLGRLSDMPFVVGGYHPSGDPSNAYQVKAESVKKSGSSYTWGRETDFPARSLTNHVIVSVDNAILVIGGNCYRDEPCFPDITESSYNLIFQFKKTVSGVWTELGRLNHGRQAHGAMVIDNKLLIVGGEHTFYGADRPTEIWDSEQTEVPESIEGRCETTKIITKIIQPYLDSYLEPLMFEVTDSFCSPGIF